MLTNHLRCTVTRFIRVHKMKINMDKSCTFRIPEKRKHEDDSSTSPSTPDPPDNIKQELQTEQHQQLPHQHPNLLHHLHNNNNNNSREEDVPTPMMPKLPSFNSTHPKLRNRSQSLAVSNICPAMILKNDRILSPQGKLTQPRLARTFCSAPENTRKKLSDLLNKNDASYMMTDVKTKELIYYYEGLKSDDVAEFQKILASEFSVDQTLVLFLSNNLTIAHERSTATLLKCEERLRNALIPRYQKLFLHIGRLPNGVKFLVDFRSHLLFNMANGKPLHADAHAATMNSCLRDLLSLWFAVGFLSLERITWRSACDVLQKISDYEAVHPIRSWSDLHRRVGAYRRCFVFTHKSMPREPVVVLHTALTSSISDNIQSIVQDVNPDSNVISELIKQEVNEEMNGINTIMFYSITSTQKGLQGVEMGNYLIKSVVTEILKEFPKMQNFSSLSPIPGFRDWFFTELVKSLHNNNENDDLVLFTENEKEKLFQALNIEEDVINEKFVKALESTLSSDTWMSDLDFCLAIQPALVRNCTYYLYKAKRRSFAYNPVAHFHLRNGAVMWRLNWLSDTSKRGLNSSFGLMVNYRYYLDNTVDNSQTYMQTQHINASEQFLKNLPMPSSNDCSSLNPMP